MVAQLDSYLALEENPDHQLQNQQDDPYEAEETLSLCDLPTHSGSAQWDDFSKEYQSSSFDQDEEDNFFEFFSEEFTASTYASVDKDIIFCGKLIPYNKEASHVATAEKKTQKNPELSNKKCSSSTKKWSIFRWRRFRGSKHMVVAKPSHKDVRNTANTISFPKSKSYKSLTLGKVSILSSNKSKSKWHLFMFGMTRFPTEMELRDIKSRQSRMTPRSPSTMLRTNFEANYDELIGNKSVKGSSVHRSSSSSSSSRAKGLWGLFRAIGCSSQHPNAVVKAASIPSIISS